MIPKSLNHRFWGVGGVVIAIIALWLTVGTYWATFLLIVAVAGAASYDYGSRVRGRQAVAVPGPVSQSAQTPAHGGKTRKIARRNQSQDSVATSRMGNTWSTANQQPQRPVIRVFEETIQQPLSTTPQRHDGSFVAASAGPLLSSGGNLPRVRRVNDR